MDGTLMYLDELVAEQMNIQEQIIEEMFAKEREEFSLRWIMERAA